MKTKKNYNCPHKKIIVSQLEYWFSKMGNKFYKFIEPSYNQRAYREGDSWTEELEISRKTFTRVFDEIGIRYKSKSAFKEAENKFQGKRYASYYDRQKKTTVFLKNTEVDPPTSNYFLKKESRKNTILKIKSSISPIENSKVSSSQSSNPVFVKKKNPEKVLPTPPQNTYQKGNININDQEKGNNINKPSLDAFPHAFSEKMCRSRTAKLAVLDIYNIYLSENTSIKPPSNFNPPSPQEQNDQSELVKNIKKIWSEKIGDDISSQKISETQVLKSFMHLFHGSIEKWKDYCHKIASSDFLMGRIKDAFKIWFSWALKEETYNRIHAGELGVMEEKTATKPIETEEVLNAILKNHSEKTIQEAFKEISKRIDPVKFNIWFKDIKFEKFDGKTLFLKGQNTLSSDYIRRNLYSELSFCFNKFNPNIKNIEIYA